MGNCLVTKLKEIVDNPNLQKLGTIVFHMTQQSTFDALKAMIRLSSNSNCLIKSVGGSFLHVDSPQNPGVSEVETSNVSVFFDNGTYDIEITNKYAITTLRTEYSDYLTVESATLQYLQNINTLRLLCPVNISDIKESTAITDLRTNLVGNISDLTCLNTVSCMLPDGATGAVGDIADFGKFTSIEFLYIYVPNIKGDIANFVDAQYANGRTSMTNLELRVMSSMKLNGEYINQSGTYHLSWNTNKKITLTKI